MIIATTFLFAVNVVLPPPSADAREVLDQVVRACRSLQTVRYSVETGMGGMQIKATYSEKRIPGAAPNSRASLFHVEGETRDGTGSVEPFEYAFDGRTLTVRGEGDAVRTYENPEEYQMGQMLGMNMMGQRPLFNDFFAQRLKEGKIRYIGRKMVGRWNCDVLEIDQKLSHPDFGDKVSTSRWAFDTTSHLPIQSTTGTITTTVTGVTINPPLSTDTFKLSGKKVKGVVAVPQTDKLLPIGSLAPAFTLRDEKGRSRSLAEFRGKVVLIDFWGTWCAPCRKSMPILQGLYAKYRSKGFVVLGISVADRENDPVGYMRRERLTYQVLVNGDSAAKAYKAVVLPTLYVLDRKGRIVFRQAGTDREDKSRLTKLIEGLVKG